LADLEDRFSALESMAGELLAGRPWGGKGYPPKSEDYDIKNKNGPGTPPCLPEGEGECYRKHHEYGAANSGSNGSAARRKYNEWYRENAMKSAGYLQAAKDDFGALEDALVHLASGSKTAALGRSGLYGYTKKTQGDCETSIRKLARTASRLAKSAWGKDPKTAQFLSIHAKRANSMPARLLVAAMQELGPKVAKEARLAELRNQEKVAKKDPRYGLYGYSTKTARLCLAACSTLREEAGHIASGLHARRASRHDRITGFLKAHQKAAKCGYSKLLLAGYPDISMKLATDEKTVQEWIEWED
jgi:hypothetical protein